MSSGMAGWLSLESALASVAAVGPTSIDRFRADIDPEWIDQALAATGTASLRRRRLPAEQVIWLVLGMALHRNRSIVEVVNKLDLALPDERGRPVAASAARGRECGAESPRARGAGAAGVALRALRRGLDEPRGGGAAGAAGPRLARAHAVRRRRHHAAGAGLARESRPLRWAPGRRRPWGERLPARARRRPHGVALASPAGGRVRPAGGGRVHVRRVAVGRGA